LKPYRSAEALRHPKAIHNFNSPKRARAGSTATAKAAGEGARATWARAKTNN